MCERGWVPLRTVAFSFMDGRVSLDRVICSDEVQSVGQWVLKGARYGILWCIDQVQLGHSARTVRFT